MNTTPCWSDVLTHKAFWIYYLRLFQNFDGDRVAACCDFFGVTRAELKTVILIDLYQLHRAGDEDITLHTLRLPTTTGATLEIAFHPDLFTPEELDHILAAQQRAWRNRLRHPRPVPVIAHPLWQAWMSSQSKEKQ